MKQYSKAATRVEPLLTLGTLALAPATTAFVLQLSLSSPLLKHWQGLGVKKKVEKTLAQMSCRQFH